MSFFDDLVDVVKAVGTAVSPVAAIAEAIDRTPPQDVIAKTVTVSDIVKRHRQETANLPPSATSTRQEDS